MEGNHLPEDSNSQDRVGNRLDNRISTDLQDARLKDNISDQRNIDDFWLNAKSAGTRAYLPDLELTDISGTKSHSRGLALAGKEGDGKQIANSEEKLVSSQEYGQTVTQTNDNGQVTSTYFANSGEKTQSIYRPDGSVSETDFDRDGRVTHNKDTKADGSYTSQNINGYNQLEITEGIGNQYVETTYDQEGNYIGKEEQWQDKDHTLHHKSTAADGRWIQTDSKNYNEKSTQGFPSGNFDTFEGGDRQSHTVNPDGSSTDVFTADYNNNYEKRRETDLQGNYTEKEMNGGKLTSTAQHIQNADGTASDKHFNANGSLVKERHIDKDGSYREQQIKDGAISSSSNHQVNADRSVSDTSFDQQGQITTNRDTMDDGSYKEQILNPDGTLELKHSDGLDSYTAEKFSPDGERISTSQKIANSDGSSSQYSTYENGSVTNRDTAADDSFKEQRLDGESKQLTVKEQDAKGNFKSTTYDSNMSVQSRTEHTLGENGKSTDLTYDDKGKLKARRENDKTGSFHQQESLPGGQGERKTEYDEERGVTWQQDFNKKGQLQSETISKPNQFKQETAYDNKGNYNQTFKNEQGEIRTTTGDSRGNFHDTLYHQESAGQLVKDGERIHRVDKAAGSKSSERKAGSESTIELDGQGNKVRQLDKQKDGSFAETTWGKNGSMLTTHKQDAKGNFKHQTFDASTKTSETVQTVNKDGSISQTRYDGTGRVISNRDTQKDGSYSEQYLKPDNSLNLYSKHRKGTGFDTKEEEYDADGNKTNETNFRQEDESAVGHAVFFRGSS